MNSGWKECKLGDVAEITSSKRIYYSEYVANGVPFFRSKEIIERFNKQNTSTELFIKRERYEEIKQKFGAPQEGDMLLTSVGTLGIPYLVRKEDEFYFKDGNLTWFRNIDSQIIDKDFLFFWITSVVGQQKLYEASIGSTQQALTIIGLKDIEILLPALNEQRTIAGVLSSLDDKIDLLHRQNKTLEGMSEALWRKMFVADVDPKWPVMAIEKIAKSIQYGLTQSAISEKSGPKFLRITDIQGGVINWQSVPYCLASEKDISNYKLYPGDIVVARTGASTGENLFIHYPPDAVFASYLIRIQCENLAVARFLSIHMRSKEYFNYIEGILSGSAQPNANAKQLTSYEVALPPLSLCNRFYDEISELDKKYVLNYEHIHNLTHIRDTLLPKLMSGEVRVKM